MAAEEYISRSLAPSTSSKYSSCLNRYLAWAARLDLVAFPLCETNLVLYASQIAQSSSYANVKLNLAAVKYFAIAHGYHVGRYDRLYLVVRGIRKCQGRKFNKPKRTPVTPNLLRMIKSNLFASDYTFADKCMLWSAMTMAFFGLLRASEYTCKFVHQYDPETDLCLNDVRCTSVGVAVRIKASKTDVFREGVTIRIAPNATSICPVNALTNYLRTRTCKNGPLFMFQNGNFLRRADVSRSMKIFSGTSENMSSHSFRIGAATTLANLGYPRWLIQSLGRWSSDAYRSYLRVADSTIREASQALVNHTASSRVYDPDAA